MSNIIKFGGGKDVLTGNMIAADLLTGKTGYSNDAKTKITGTLVAGKRYATGIKMADGILVVRGLSFKPSVFMAKQSSSDGTAIGNGSNSVLYVASSMYSLINDTQFKIITTTVASMTTCNLYSDGIEMDVPTSFANYNWIALE